MAINNHSNKLLGGLDMEFNLSEKASTPAPGVYEATYSKEDVKEFIRLVKEGFYIWNETGGILYVMEKIDKLAGDKLI